MSDDDLQEFILGETINEMYTGYHNNANLTYNNGSDHNYNSDVNEQTDVTISITQSGW